LSEAIHDFEKSIGPNWKVTEQAISSQEFEVQLAVQKREIALLLSGNGGK
jgi:hypothetical protein